uniref:Uncharacterized protein n=1 Tax=Lotharella globosa TaxID=91324 RepID=A0A6U2Z6W0_9EUKA|mmetsp:Transcript_10535/g.20919  ORF Transcript_10535/g.20919 Transcript_10535/m.20919 type:complete len:203 (+) Transcript_10535:173-781(+)|eukprot:CAMPEP_0167771296 /NCGR_PEP_ID=MMETSP0111_2-20121227/199_1 /TAXON_ID=91324 /ORGANISM="Lotharella globosa, Strain CCCM811" /LENGTH=202 /DNA_ID=CAMNT_0007660633 /DNA_START=127 /DNA_END=735 /DNA_ORIENTATION=-
MRPCAESNKAAMLNFQTPCSSLLNELFVEDPPPLLADAGQEAMSPVHNDSQLESNNFDDWFQKDPKDSPDQFLKDDTATSATKESDEWERTPERKEGAQLSQTLFPYDSSPALSRESSFDGKKATSSTQDLLKIDSKQTILSAETLRKMKSFAMSKSSRKRGSDSLESLSKRQRKQESEEEGRKRAAYYIAQRLVTGSLLLL